MLYYGNACIYIMQSHSYLNLSMLHSNTNNLKLINILTIMNVMWMNNNWLWENSSQIVEIKSLFKEIEM